MTHDITKITITPYIDCWVISSFIDPSGYASGPIRRCLFIDYIIKGFLSYF